MPKVELGEILNEIGSLLISEGDVGPNAIFLYVEAGRAWVEPSPFKVFDDRIVYEWPSEGLIQELMKLWEAEEPDKRWSIMQYEVKDGKFDAVFEFEEDIDPDEGFDRRERILRERYGDKSVEYPPLRQFREEDEG